MNLERRKVINRDGIIEDLNIEKIREKLVRACAGLEVNMVELESKIESIYEENITNKKNSRIFNQFCSQYDKL